MHQQATLQQPGGIATTIAGFTNQSGAASTIAFMPQTALTAMQQQQHVAYAQAPFNHHQPQQQQTAIPCQPQQMQAQQNVAASQQQQKPIEEQLHQENQETKHDDESPKIDMGHGGPSAVPAKPQGYAAAAASTNGTASYAKQVQQNNETLQDTMASIDDWNAEDAGLTSSGTSEPRADKGSGFRNGGGRGGYRGARGGDRGGRNNQNGDRGGYRGGNGGFRGSERGERGGGRGEYGSRRGGSGRGGGSGERGERGGRVKIDLLREEKDPVKNFEEATRAPVQEDVERVAEEEVAVILPSP